MLELLARLPVMTWNDPDLERRKLSATEIPPNKYPFNQPYNGFEGLERRRLALFLRWCQLAGILSWPKSCDICASPKNVSFHSENYYNVLQAIPLCKLCHKILHMRFRSQNAWLDLSERYADGTRWHECVTTEQRIDIAIYLRNVHGQDAFVDPFHSPFYMIPEWVPAPTGSLPAAVPLFDVAGIRPAVQPAASRPIRKRTRHNAIN